MPYFDFLFRWIDRFRNMKAVVTLYWLVRAAMGLGFIGSGIRKLPGVKFTALPIKNPVGYFFDAMYQTGFYWNTIGLIQILLGVLIFFNRSVVAAVLIMVPITLNIFLVSIALQMQGTPLITISMLLANIFLLFWHYENYLPIVRRPEYQTERDAE